MFYSVLFACAVGMVSAANPVYLKSYLQPNDDVDRATFLNYTADSVICARECVAGQTPKICYYQWTVENYATLSDACRNCPKNLTDCYNNQCIPADGYERGILSINRKFPGPSIEVCLGDRVIVDITNNMAGRTVAIHWHGVFQQGSQFMDGVPMLTQCTIHESNTFRYDFIANNEGTHFWHSHDGLQKLDGLEGNLIIRSPKDYDPNGNLYDFDLPEHKLFISDWLHLPADDHFPGLLRADSGQDANSFLINGKGRTLIGTQSTITPYAQINVQSGMRYRFRIIGGLCTVCPTQLTVDGHKMLVIATDGNPVAPMRVDSLNIYSGERYDVVIEATNSPGPYWIHVKGLATCVVGRVYQLGVLQYEGATTKLRALPYDPGYDGFPPTANYRVLNPENATCSSGSNGVCNTQLVNPFPVPKNILKQLPDFNFLLTFGFESLNPNALFKSYDRYFVSPDLDLLSSTMNNISFVAPPVPPLTQSEDIPAGALCPVDANGLPQCPGGQSYCACVHVIKIPLGALVQIILSDDSPRSDLNHPFHLHGYAFYVMDMGQYAEGQTPQNLLKDLNSNVRTVSTAPILKDTIAVPSGGYAVIKFKANNPGYWFLHCHFLYHIATGMSVVLQVGEKSDVPTPPTGFPKCGSFTPQVYTN
ncbi:laccase-2-like isoform X2 [Zootermopsis nevadensis]|uniref:Laccase-4 n=2 Tax=Zootermopsis nevadensis TaxID=136037 RepID=A0A067R247_ZOONE|nr:laccase-2-like isoform X2 [Zootermopsis nevadensis]KDR11747.1 Laccase-4 [Zootermopsis nevadensis]